MSSTHLIQHFTASQKQAIIVRLHTLMGRDYECVDVDWEEPAKILRIFIDRPNGVDITDCAKIHRALLDDASFDELAPEHNYSLEVSSPGLERPLRTREHFLKQLGNNVSLCYRKDNHVERISGQLISCEDKDGDSYLSLKTKNGKQIEITLSSVIKANLKIDWNVI